MGERTDAVSGNDRTDEIRRDIERTQREMSRTIDEIQHRLSPHYMMQRTKDSMREAGVNASRSFIDKVRDNPIPAAMVGAGMWLLLRDSDRDRGRYEVEFIPAGNDYSSVAEYRDLEYEGAGRMTDLRERASHLADRARALGSNARYRMSSAGRQSRDVLTDNPLITGLAALAMGALIGALIPETEKERELMGETRDRLAHQAKEMAREGVDRARDIATTATHAATDAVKSEVKNPSRKDDFGQPVGIPTT
ncbi:MAG TPA: DUF3618 domain-containing protein [Thermoanaerobaculia bacterium]|nr:DUF3618 domain-containing protein [Thermoanaerobaculia bacterium]